MGQGKSLLALTVIKNVEHECKFEGCNMKLKFAKIKEHEDKCIWRLVLCPGKGSHCRALIPLCSVLNHVEHCRDCKWPPKQVLEEEEMRNHILIKATHVGRPELLHWSTKVVQLNFGPSEKFFFFVRFAKKDGFYVLDVVMKGSQEDCENFAVEASMVDGESGKGVFKAFFKPRPMTDNNEAIYCLFVPEKGVSKAWKYDAVEGWYCIDFGIKIAKLN